MQQQKSPQSPQKLTSQSKQTSITGAQLKNTPQSASKNPVQTAQGENPKELKAAKPATAQVAPSATAESAPEKQAEPQPKIEKLAPAQPAGSPSKATDKPVDTSATNKAEGASTPVALPQPPVPQSSGEKKKPAPKRKPVVQKQQSQPQANTTQGAATTPTAGKGKESSIKPQPLKQASSQVEPKSSTGSGAQVKATPVQNTLSKAPSQTQSQAKQSTSHTPSAAQPKAAARPANSTEDDGLADRWPNLDGAADWNRREREQEALDNLAKLSGISLKDKGVAAKTQAQKAQQAALLQLQQQYRQQNFHEMCSFDLNKEIRVDSVRSQVQVTWEKYPGSKTGKSTTKATGGTELPHKRLKRPGSTDQMLAEEAKAELEKRPRRGGAKLLFEGSTAESEELKEYLDLCNFVMREASSNLNGMLLRGSSQYPEKAMKILADHNYNFDMAKFSILYPTVLLIPERKRRFQEMVKADDAFLSKVVREAVVDLRGCKQDEIDAAIDELRLALKSGGLKPEELEVHERKLEKMRVKMPDDLEGLLAEAEEFSKGIKKKLNPVTSIEKRLTLSQLEELQAEAATHCLETAEIVRLQTQVQNAKEWLARVEESHGEEITLKDLEKLVKAGRQVPVNFGEPYERVSNRLSEALNLQRRIQATFKSNKTRGAQPVGGADPNSLAESKTPPGGRQLKSNHGTYQEELNLDLQREGKALRVTFKDLDDLSELIGRVQSWKGSASTFLEQTSAEGQLQRKDKFKNYLNEAKLLKLDRHTMPLVAQLQEQFEYIEWKGQVNALWKKVGLQEEAQQAEVLVSPDPGSESGSDAANRSSNEKGPSKEEVQPVPNIEAIVVQGDSYVSGWNTDSKQLVALHQGTGTSRVARTRQRKLELGGMRQLIEDMISKGFYQPKGGKLASEKASLERANEGTPENPEKDEESPQVPKTVIRLDEESGQLELIDFDLASKPPSVRKLLETYIEANELIDDLQTFLEELTEFSGSSSLAQTNQKELFDISVLRDIWVRSSKLIVHVPYLDNLWEKLKELRDLEADINSYSFDFSQQAAVGSSLAQTIKEELKQAFSLVQKIHQTGIKTATFIDFHNRIQPMQKWCYTAKVLVKEYYKQADLKHSQLMLLDSSMTSKPLQKLTQDRKRGKELDDVEMQSKNGDQSDFDALNSLTKEAREVFKALQMTNEFEHLEKISDKVKTWRSRCKDTLTQLNKIPAEKNVNLQEQTHLVTVLDDLVSQALPVPAELLESASKTHKVRRWKLKYWKLKISKSVTLKQIEMLAKEAKSSTLLDDEFCKQVGLELEEQHRLSQEWTTKFDGIEDGQDSNLIKELIDQGRQLKFHLDSYSTLSEHYRSIIQIKESFEQLFRCPVKGNSAQELISEKALQELICLKEEIEEEDEGADQESGSKLLIEALEPQQPPAQENPGQGSLSSQEKGQEIDLLKSIETLVEVWRTIARRTLSVFENQRRVNEALKVDIVLQKTQQQNKQPTYKLERCAKALGTCAICKNKIIKSSLTTFAANSQMEFSHAYPSQDQVRCKKCEASFHRNCVRAVQIQGLSNYKCYACSLTKIKLFAFESQQKGVAFENEDKVETMYLELLARRRQRLTINQLAHLVRAGQNLLSTVHLPELASLTAQWKRAEQVRSEILAEVERTRETLKNLTEASLSKLKEEQTRATRLITMTESLVVDLNTETGQLATEIARRSQLIESYSK